jgi:hypothetical protein
VEGALGRPLEETDTLAGEDAAQLMGAFMELTSRGR